MAASMPGSVGIKKENEIRYNKKPKKKQAAAKLAFANSSLQKITFHGPVNVEELAFAGCSSLSTMENLHWMTKCESKAFQGHKWTDKDYQDGLVIKDGWLLAIDGDYDFEDLQLPDTVTSIAGRVFENNKKITGVTIPDQVKIKRIGKCKTLILHFWDIGECPLHFF